MVSKRMRAIKGSNTSIEIMVRKELWNLGYRYRLKTKLTGRPDIVFVTRRVAVFIDGDFWHGKNFKALLPKLKNEFWVGKIRRNIKRDKKVTKYLRKSGWQVVRVWESEIHRDLDLVTKRIIAVLG